MRFNRLLLVTFVLGILALECSMSGGHRGAGEDLTCRLDDLIQTFENPGTYIENNEADSDRVDDLKDVSDNNDQTETGSRGGSSCIPLHILQPSVSSGPSRDYLAEYKAQSSIEKDLHSLNISEIPGAAPGPRVFPGPRMHFRQPPFKNPNSILKVSVRNYLVKLGFDDLDREYRVENLREMLMERLSLPPERVTRDTLAHLQYFLKQKIFSFLDVGSMLSACVTCSEMAALVDEPGLWRMFVYRTSAENGFLHPAYPARHRGWKTTLISMIKIVREPSHCDEIWNIIVQGDVRVGKDRLVCSLGNSILKRSKGVSRVLGFKDDPVIDAVTGIYRFSIDFVTRRIISAEKIIKLQVWDGGLVVGDTAVFGAAHIVLFMMDITVEESFRRLPAILKETSRSTRCTQSSCKFLLVGNTTGKPEKRTVSFESAKRFANERGLVYFEANIDNAAEVDAAFVRLAQEFSTSESSEFISMHDKSKVASKQCSVM
eukprot:311984_1